MNINDLFTTTEQKFKQAFEHLQIELKKVRTGRANASMLDSVKVEAYGTPMPLIQVATISCPEPQLLQISPFDPNNIQSISQAIRDNQSLGFNPTDDGRIIRIPIPPLNEERRREIVKQLGAKAEEAMIRMRNIRHEAREIAEGAKKDKDIGEDEFSRFEKQVDEIMQRYKTQCESAVKAKEREIMTV
ncbi:MAG TPA: ribosome recycling factor [Candidatus Saccharibacteria bacterium]|nr:ribosome recycling factor [Candidatus Saccharibacteria bacterium]